MPGTPTRAPVTVSMVRALVLCTLYLYPPHFIVVVLFVCIFLTYCRWARTCQVPNPSCCNVAILLMLMPVVTKGLSISPQLSPYDFLSRCKFNTFTTRPRMIEFNLLMSRFHKNRTHPHDFRTCARLQHLLDHSGVRDLNYVPGTVLFNTGIIQ